MAKTRHYTFIWYPEDEKETSDFVDYLKNDLMIPFSYIIHDKDLKDNIDSFYYDKYPILNDIKSEFSSDKVDLLFNELLMSQSDDSEFIFKKTHCHFICSFPGPITPKLAEERLSNSGYFSQHFYYKNPTKFMVSDIALCTQYHIHKNDPDKYQYDRADIFAFNSFDLDKYLTLTDSELNIQLLELIQIVEQYNCLTFTELIKCLRSSGRDELVTYCRQNVFLTSKLCDDFYKMGIRKMQLDKLANINKVTND